MTFKGTEYTISGAFEIMASHGTILAVHTRLVHRHDYFPNMDDHAIANGVIVGNLLGGCVCMYTYRVQEF